MLSDFYLECHPVQAIITPRFERRVSLFSINSRSLSINDRHSSFGCLNTAKTTGELVLSGKWYERCEASECVGGRRPWSSAFKSWVSFLNHFKSTEIKMFYGNSFFQILEPKISGCKTATNLFFPQSFSVYIGLS